MNYYKPSILFLTLFMLIQQVNSQTNVDREFRGAWIATVKNIDWPSTNTLTTEEQKKELIKLLDSLKSLNLNAVILQIRPSADAFYNSKFEPWSEYLTGSGGKAPSPYYDPLAFAISETHKRGMEFHAWLNPYRALIDYEESESNSLSLIDEKPDWFVNYGKNKYFNPGIPEVRAYTKKVVADIVQNYDVDAIHFDDYFYPYKIEGEPFPDSESFKSFGGNYYPDQLEDWRRNNVNIIIKELASTIKNIKPWVQFGISPFGVWRNKHVDPLGSDTKAGQTNYDNLYADILLWLKNDWLDYVLPQVYWEIGHKVADYNTIVNWWVDNSFNANLYIGQGVYKLDPESSKTEWKQAKPTEIGKQIEFNRSINRVQGHVFYSANTFLKNSLNINDELKNNYFKYPKLPRLINHSEKHVPQPVFNVKIKKQKHGKFCISWESLPENIENEAVKFLVYEFNEGDKIDITDESKIIALTGENHIILDKKDMKNAHAFVIQAVSRSNNISDPIRVFK